MAERLPNLPNIKPELLDLPTVETLKPTGDLNHPPRILEHFGGEVKNFDRV